MNAPMQKRALATLSVLAVVGLLASGALAQTGTQTLSRFAARGPNAVRAMIVTG